MVQKNISYRENFKRTISDCNNEIRKTNKEKQEMSAKLEKTFRFILFVLDAQLVELILNLY